MHTLDRPTPSASMRANSAWVALLAGVLLVIACAMGGQHWTAHAADDSMSVDRDGLVDAREFGLRGDVGGDQSDALERALAAARELDAILVLPGGSIGLSRSLVLQHGDRIRGRGMFESKDGMTSGTRLHAEGDLEALVTNDVAKGLKGVVIEDLTLDGSERAQHAADFVALHDSILRRVSVRKAVSDGLVIRGLRDKSGAIVEGFPGDANHNELDRVIAIRNGGWGIVLTGSEGDGETQRTMARTNNTLLSATRALKNAKGGILNERGTSTSGLQVVATDNNGAGIEIRWYGTLFLGTTVERNEGPGIWVRKTPHTKENTIIATHNGGGRFDAVRDDTGKTEIYGGSVERR